MVLSVVVGVFRIVDLVNRAMKQLKPVGIDVCLVDESSAPERSVLHVHRSRTRQEMLSPSDGLDFDAAETRVESDRFTFAGRSWGIDCRPTDAYLAHTRSWAPAFVPAARCC